MTGSSPLTAEQTAWYEDRFGLRYVTVAENHLRPSRRTRRGRHRDVHDVAVHQAQIKTILALRRNPLEAHV